MKKKRHSNEQIVAILREADASSVAEAAMKHAVTDQTIGSSGFRVGVVAFGHAR